MSPVRAMCAGISIAGVADLEPPTKDVDRFDREPGDVAPAESIAAIHTTR
ncbi:MAG: hypothetical protein ACRDXC_11050 [Acidimicrobiales bacterium]